MSIDRERHHDVQTAAANWFAAQRRGGADEAAFATWLAGDLAHAKAYAAVQLAWQRVDAVRAEPEIIALREAATRARPVVRRRFAWAAGGIAASLVLAVMASVTFWPEARIFLAESPRIEVADAKFDLDAQLHRTEIGERKSLHLPDGSVLTLDTDSVIRTAYSADTRLVMLERGQAFFEVAADRSRPFIVFAGNKRVMAVGTAFDVRVDGDDVQVTLREGRVRVEAPILDGTQEPGAAHVQAAELVPGSRLNASSRSGWHLARADMGRDLSWLHGQLIFDGERLANVVAEMNRYSTTKIVIADPALATVPISGVFAAGQPMVLAEALAEYRLARITERTPDRIMLIAP